jgi:hypothetical protein
MKNPISPAPNPVLQNPVKETIGANGFESFDN